jgi:hypothetical protein
MSYYMLAHVRLSLLVSSPMRDTTPIALTRTPRYLIHRDKTTSMRLSIRFPKQRCWCVIDHLRLVPKN